MKATGIVRRIDDLGRVVIPKEIRRTLRLREGTPLEIFTDREGEIILKKYSPMAELGAFARQYADALASGSGCIVCICDRDQVLAATNGAKNLMQKPVSKTLEQLSLGREVRMTGKGDQKYVPVTAEGEEFSTQLIVPILSEGDAVGAVILLSKDTRMKMGETELKLAQTAAGFLGRQMEG